ncbi:MAG: hypothetical protein JW709_04355 [Sedimentisphaerales bacterium]|nr:hypothetical protein [Sedimentisphaerales bacterium]
MKHFIPLLVVLSVWEIAAVAAEQITPPPVKPKIQPTVSVTQPPAKPVVPEKPSTPPAEKAIIPRLVVGDPNTPHKTSRLAGPVPVRKPGSRNRTLLVLNRRPISVDYKELDLEAVLNDWRDRTGVNMVVYWPAIESTGINRDDPITLRLDDVAPERVLGMVLKQVSGGGRGAITYRIAADGVIEIDVASPWDAYEFRVYYIADLIERPSMPQSYR